MSPSPYEMITSLKGKVYCLHLHSNDLHHDNHELPLTMDVDFSKIIKALKEINYKGDFTLECESYVKNRPNEDIFKLAKDMKDAINKIRELFLKD